MPKLIIVLAGRKQAGKTTASNQIARIYLMETGQVEPGDLDINGQGLLVSRLPDPIMGRLERELDIQPGATEPPFRGERGVRVISFADLLKQFCIDVLGLTHAQCHGTDGDKNSLTHILWEAMPREIRARYAARSWWRPWTWRALRTGPLTAREVMQVVGTDMVRRMHSEAWARSAFRYAIRVPEPLVIIPDGRFPNEVTAAALYHDGKDVFTRCVRLLRAPFKDLDTHRSETALEGFPNHHFHLVVPEGLSVDEQGRFLEGPVRAWLAEAGLAGAKRAA